MSKKEYIERNALIAEYDRVHIGPPGGARKLMVDAPTADVVEVVRCSECKYKDDCARQMVHISTCNKVDFCSYGERRADDGSKDCLHEKVCVWNAELEEACNEDCSDFKNKADYAEVKHGEWITKVLWTGTLYLTGAGHDNELQWLECSLCGRKTLVKEPYCHCGAKMDGRSDGDE